jgi:hypothetical protein
MTIDELITRIKPGRKVHGASAALLPFEDDGRIAVEAFQARIAATHRAGLTNAVNMDTGYAKIRYVPFGKARSCAPARTGLDWNAASAA